MKCYNCAAQLPQEARFCDRCGADQGFSQELIDRAKANNQGAITELYQKTYSGVYYTIKSMIKDEDAALDILQDSFIKAFKNLNQLKEADKFRSWVKRIAHNRSIDHLRKHKPIMFSEMQGEDSDAPIDFEDTNIDNLPEEVVDRDETARLLREILDDLPDEQRAVISMFYYEQLPVKQIAYELSVSENTVKSRLNYARKKIETKVRELEKKGTKLYGLAPIPFLRLLFQSQDDSPAPVPPSVKHKILSNQAYPTAVEIPQAVPAAGQAAGSGTTAKTGFFAALKSSLLLKIIAGALAVAIVAGGAVTVYYLGKGDEEGSGAAGGGGGIGRGQPMSQPEEVIASEGIPTELPTESPTEPPAPTEPTPENLSRYSGEYTDPTGTITVTLPEVWSQFGKIDAKQVTNGSTNEYMPSEYYRVEFGFENTYNNYRAYGSSLELLIIADPNYDPGDLNGSEEEIQRAQITQQELVARSEHYTIVRQLHNGRGLYMEDTTNEDQLIAPDVMNAMYESDEYAQAQSDASQLTATFDSILDSLVIHDN